VSGVDDVVFRSGMNRVLMIKFGAIGDVVMAIPAAYAMHQAGAEVDWVCGAQVLPLLELYPWVRPIVVDDRTLFHGTAAERFGVLMGLWRTIGGREYALCATLYYDARYRVVSLPVRAKRRVMLSHSDRLRTLLPGRHHTDEYLRVMQGVDGGPATVGLAPVRAERLPPSSLPRLPGAERVLLVPAGARNALRSDGLRRWPMESYVAVARRLLELELAVVLVGGPDDGWASEAFRGTGATDVLGRVTDVIGRLTIVETLALMEDSDVVVTHDTGPLHLAGLTSVGIVSLFGPTDPRGRLPQRAGTMAMWGGEGFACRPCYDGRSYADCKENLCVQQVTPEMVVREVQFLLSQRRAGTLLPPRVVSPVSTVTASFAERRTGV